MGSNIKNRFEIAQEIVQTKTLKNIGLNNQRLNQSKSPPPKPKSSSSSLGYSFFFGAYFLGYYFFFYWAAGLAPVEATGADPALPILLRPLAINLLTSFPLKVSMSLLRSSSETLTLADPRTVFKSAAAKIL